MINFNDHDSDDQSVQRDHSADSESHPAAIAALRQAVEDYERSLAEMHAVATCSDDDVLSSRKRWHLAIGIAPVEAVRAAERASQKRNLRREDRSSSPQDPPPDMAQQLYDRIRNDSDDK